MLYHNLLRGLLSGAAWLLCLIYTRPGDRVNGLKNGKTQLFFSRGVVKWAYFPEKWSVTLTEMRPICERSRLLIWKALSSEEESDHTHWDYIYAYVVFQLRTVLQGKNGRKRPDVLWCTSERHRLLTEENIQPFSVFILKDFLFCGSIVWTIISELC